MGRFSRAPGEGHGSRNFPLFTGRLRPVEPRFAAPSAQLHARRGDRHAQRDSRRHRVPARPLLGHSDGASIATIYAGSIQDHRVRGLVLIAPHFFVEDVSIKSIAEAKTAYESGDLKGKLARWHSDPDNAFHGWNGAWLDPRFRAWDITQELAYIRVPILIVQGEDDQYGTAKQIEAAQEECYCPVDVTLVPGARHAPHREAADLTLETVAAFINRLLRTHGEAQAA
ncbi:MAG: alpha/beta hydrolase [Pseudorhodoplanes sp.]|nr:alpha/beta hydrolase [Pseudorhodoplanes sp.]